MIVEVIRALKAAVAGVNVRYAEPDINSCLFPTS